MLKFRLKDFLRVVWIENGIGCVSQLCVLSKRTACCVISSGRTWLISSILDYLLVLFQSTEFFLVIFTGVVDQLRPQTAASLNSYMRLLFITNLSELCSKQIFLYNRISRVKGRSKHHSLVRVNDYKAFTVTVEALFASFDLILLTVE